MLGDLVILELTNAHIWGFCISFVIALIIVPVVRHYCLKKGLVDLPGERKVHKEPIPRLGGVAIWTSTLLTFVILVFLNFQYPHGNGLSGILVGGSIMFLLGLVDDVYDLSPKYKLVIQIGAALVAFLLGVKIEFINNPIGAPVFLGLFTLPVTILWLVGISNALNFIDGVDGLAGAVSTISAVTLCIVALSSNNPQPIIALVSAILAGSMMGFLLFNFNPAKIFMGDSGALFSGFTLAALSVLGVFKSLTLTILLPLFILSVPIMDITFSVFRRISKGKNPFVADSEHIHHKLLKAGLSHNKTVALFILISVSTGILAVSFVGANGLYLYIICVVVALMFLLSKISKSRAKNIDKEIIDI